MPVLIIRDLTEAEATEAYAALPAHLREKAVVIREIPLVRELFPAGKCGSQAFNALQHFPTLNEVAAKGRQAIAGTRSIGPGGIKIIDDLLQANNLEWSTP